MDETDGILVGLVDAATRMFGKILIRKETRKVVEIVAENAKKKELWKKYVVAN